MSIVIQPNHNQITFYQPIIKVFQTLLHKQHKPITHHAYFKNDWLL
ncbi:hypothetical protein EJK55_1430 [Moraxella catarrhalis]|uniref:Uncharacterized protein n=1 Tax=Moraxella catarrhalis TaxID=480 RepID=A0A3Q9GED3_MORCA|nr:hypothetical protein EJK50_1798 [Moraxella catarrhalis]AZQ94078.1 hypothetical protein EJK53_1976 [Moraxella catarrhalis]AZQ94930.1 hypothetical protein EJK48_1812 [Moraxella catarrhalis]RUO13101.1 hypothetical protein EJK55_1430 [Moraxella catarrhalis]RUO13829.1 hypothetical protein EJK49_0934 [Moraxella catarrhalis]